MFSSESRKIKIPYSIIGPINSEKSVIIVNVKCILNVKGFF